MLKDNNLRVGTVLDHQFAYGFVITGPLQNDETEKCMRKKLNSMETEITQIIQNKAQTMEVMRTLWYHPATTVAILVFNLAPEVFSFSNPPNWKTKLLSAVWSHWLSNCPPPPPLPWTNIFFKWDLRVNFELGEGKVSINMVVQNRRLKHESTTLLQHSLALSVEIECFYSVLGDHLSFIRTVGASRGNGETY